ncbi:MAG: lysophospholipid acyltransferase family protein [Candidatus Omnitrophica bacterium]|nr:lysophospholipid acyltransferase family protein [Candidatus Omnitrophota bacterium]MBU1889017.1 lysophospholipid acyltransferase family protein [Candidatus Omnitrophota bacterium]
MHFYLIPSKIRNFIKWLKFNTLPPIIWLLMYLIGKTTKFTVIGEENYKKTKGPVIFTFWHNRIFLSVYYYRYILNKKNICVLLSPSKDGELLAKVINKLGFASARGSSKHYSKNTFTTMLAAFKKGFDAAIVPDGPQGPKYKAKLGVIRIAQKAGIPLIPVAYNVSRKKILSTWDSFLLPLPFSRAVLIYDKPLMISSDINEENAKTLLEKRLTKITKEADEYFNK